MTDILNGAITDWLTEAIENAIQWIVDAIFSIFNFFVSDIAGSLTTSPAEWKFMGVSIGPTIAQNLFYGEIHDALVAIAGIILAYVACYELITIVIDRNNLADIDTWIFIRWIFKTAIATIIVTHGTDIILAIFQAGQWLGGKIGTATASIEVEITGTQAWTAVQNLLLNSQGVLLQLLLFIVLMLVVYLIMVILGVLSLWAVYGHVLQALLLMCIAPIPLATLGNQEMGHIGKDYLKSLASCALEGVIMLIVVRIYALIAENAISDAIVSVLTSSTGVLDIFKALLIAVLSALILYGGLKGARTIANYAFGGR